MWQGAFQKAEINLHAIALTTAAKELFFVYHGWERIQRRDLVGCLMLDLRQVFEIVQVFVPAGGLLVDFETREIDQVDFNAVQSIDDATRVAL